MADAVTVPGPENRPALPLVLAGANTPEIERRFENFFQSVAAIFKAWVGWRSQSTLLVKNRSAQLSTHLVFAKLIPIDTFDVQKTWAVIVD